jgi:hypothetical protein
MAPLTTTRRSGAAGHVTLRSPYFLLLLAATLLSVAPSPADATWKTKAVRCSDSCLSCERVRGRIKGYPKRRLLASAAKAPAGEDSASPKNAPLRVVCTRCQTGYVPAKPFGLRCGESTEDGGFGMTWRAGLLAAAGL